MHDKLVDAGKPRDRVEVRMGTCLFFHLKSCLVSKYGECILLPSIAYHWNIQAMSIRVGPTQRTVKSILKVNAIDICLITMVESFVSETALNPVLLFSHGILSSFRHSLIVFHIKKTSHFNTSKFVCFRPETAYTICTFSISGCVITYMSYSQWKIRI
jgi:hypothetical protein